MGEQELTGTLFDIQGFSVHDGPGCRTLVFLKGCTLNCRWCSNPEGKRPYPEPLYRADRCMHDHLCVETCVSGAITVAGSTLVIDRSLCASCAHPVCTDVCFTGALQQGGYTITLEKLYATIRRDRQYWGSKGGITLTGGEPFLQHRFTTALLKRCHDAWIHTAAETCGYLAFDHYQAALPFLDWLFFDIKHMVPMTHRNATGYSNQLILENARKISREFSGRMVFRMVVIPGFNDQPEHLEQVAQFIRSTGRNEINLLPLHHLGSTKYPLTGAGYYTEDLSTPPPEILQSIKQQLETAGLHCYIGSDTPF